MTDARRKGINTPTAMRVAFQAALDSSPKRTSLTGKVFRALKTRNGFVWSPGWTVSRKAKAA